MGDLLEALRRRKKANLLMTAVNIAVFAVLEIMGDTEDARFMAAHGACWPPYVAAGQYWRLFTAMFLHFGFEHLFNNMISLFFLGEYVESAVGPAKYLAIYLGGGLAGNVLSVLLSLRGGDNAVSAGASGAIFALMGALVFIALRNVRSFGRGNMNRMLLAVALMVLQGTVDKGVDGAAHMGGLAGGFVLGLLLYRRKDHTGDKDLYQS